MQLFDENDNKFVVALFEADWQLVRTYVFGRNCWCHRRDWFKSLGFTWWSLLLHESKFNRYERIYIYVSVKVALSLDQIVVCRKMVAPLMRQSTMLPGFGAKFVQLYMAMIITTEAQVK